MVCYLIGIRNFTILSFFMDFYFGSITLIILSLTLELISALGIVYSSDEQRTIKRRHRGLAGDCRDGC